VLGDVSTEAAVTGLEVIGLVVAGLVVVGLVVVGLVVVGLVVVGLVVVGLVVGGLVVVGLVVTGLVVMGLVDGGTSLMVVGTELVVIEVGGEVAAVVLDGATVLGAELVPAGLVRPGPPGEPPPVVGSMAGRVVVGKLAPGEVVLLEPEPEGVPPWSAPPGEPRPVRPGVVVVGLPKGVPPGVVVDEGAPELVLPG
jgi:hypothetical protein